MARNGWCVLCVWLVTASLLSAAEPEAPGLPPQFTVVTKLDADAGEVEVQYVVTTPVMETFKHPFTNPATGKVETETFRRITNVPVTRARRIQLADVRMITAAQKAIDPSDFSKRLTPDTTVLVLDSNRKLEARYLATLKDETLIMIVKPEPPKVMPHFLGRDDGVEPERLIAPLQK